MSQNSFGQLFRITTFGESHGAGLGVVVDGVPAGIELSTADFLPELARRRPGQSAVTTARRELDEPEILSGVFEGRTIGSPVAVLVRNTNQRSNDYEHLRDSFRPGHADETYARKYAHRDHRGGGRSSGRETLARVIGGVVARKLLPPDCRILGHTKRVGPVEATRFDADVIESNSVRAADLEAAKAMEAFILDCKSRNDSVGALVEVRVSNPPASLGEPLFGKAKARFADAFLSVGAVTGFSYGAGFQTASMQGRDYVANREHFGGILGGITTGEDLHLTASIKPTTSLGKVAEQGRHDPCIAPRVVPVLEAMTAITLADLVLLARTNRSS